MRKREHIRGWVKERKSKITERKNDLVPKSQSVFYIHDIYSGCFSMLRIDVLF